MSCPTAWDGPDHALSSCWTTLEEVSQVHVGPMYNLPLFLPGWGPERGPSADPCWRGTEDGGEGLTELPSPESLEAEGLISKLAGPTAEL